MLNAVPSSSGCNPDLKQGHIWLCAGNLQVWSMRCGWFCFIGNVSVTVRGQFIPLLVFPPEMCFVGVTDIPVIIDSFSTPGAPSLPGVPW